jgi:hypothetical protein
MSDLLKVCDLWQRERRGNTEGSFYLTGRLAGLKLVILPKRRPDENGSSWTVFVTEPSPPRQGAQEGEGTHPTSGPTASQLARSERQQSAGAGILSAVGRHPERPAERDPGQRDTGDESAPFDDQIPF